MSLARSRRGRPLLRCGVVFCRSTFHVKRDGETVVELRLRATLRGWRRVRRVEVCPLHDVVGPRGLELVVTDRRGPRRSR